MRFVGKRPLCEGGWFSDVQLCDSNMQLCDCPVFYKTNNSSNCTFSELFPALRDTKLRPDLPSKVKLLSPRRLQSLFHERNLEII